jgi:hypothetical protein
MATEGVKIDHRSNRSLFAWLGIIVGYVLLLIANTATLVWFTLCTTFAVELSVKLLRTLSWRVVAYSSGAYGAILLLATAVVTIFAIVARS